MAEAPETARAETPDERIYRAMRNRVTTARFGTSVTGYVADAETGEWIWSKNQNTALMPASTTKLVTAHNALMTFGTGYRFTTYVKQGPKTNRVIVHGVGDPSLSSAQLNAMAKTVAATMRSRGVTSTRVYIDDDRFPTPTLAHGWKSSYVPSSIGPVRALMRDQRRSTDSGADVGRYFADRLTTNGMRASYYGRANVAGGARVLARSQGERMSTTISQMLLRSDNEIAEALHRLVAWKKGKSTSWGGARSAQRAVMSSKKLPMTSLYDGSGLSRSDRLSSKQLATLLVRSSDYDYPSLWPIRNSQGMPTAGRTGTLTHRFDTYTSRCAAGKVWAKTGTLNDVTALAGYTYGKDGRKKVFAFLVNGRKNTETLKSNLDMLAATVNGCY
ncbi:D-alanyl-D-alanine carboxypeptidase [Phycicoccus sp. CSK15P-2]|uniref:D-alanyl-D-alanine carboxypeptidase/D-alanyl-D-alanine-endopeptidase n=1 Tax=Phycicoccus sp. CSK15P-2 TaxID=2807627 RepID=UPI00194ED281|nr:D-alanyl-D-alanine carboxypeptidase [Phycicoccus sp. CSK15P-2]MBM6403339.1 D-alanyl-D-alanine carboxypeptidase [Phycicoccus sp. CSK15P-2]